MEKPDYSEAKIVVAMVGLPARGKSFLSNKLMRYLTVRSGVRCTPSMLMVPLHSGWSTRSKSSTSAS